MIKEKLVNSIEVDEKSGCWNWAKYKNKDGYGGVWYQGKMRRAPRVAFEAFLTPIPDGKLVLHKCDNPACINPDHLFLGTHRDNAEDRNRKQRQTQGERHPNAKLSAEQVRQYKSLREAARYFLGPHEGSKLARSVSGISKSTADHIDCGRRWKSVGASTANDLGAQK
ncbi:HNH endonuclease signature motif containing protein [Noviherbaspirillum sp.]|uniref:HNH endonuclease signature motif containing protein n=1 Tax=Noviherbaspirillum sp. TaxID=1926288 RepID=UPI002B46CE31|nr:HNH endonuclease signature motif containing protein [Noviherbaspirillum sp.]